MTRKTSLIVERGRTEGTRHGRECNIVELVSRRRRLDRARPARPRLRATRRRSSMSNPSPRNTWPAVPSTSMTPHNRCSLATTPTCLEWQKRTDRPRARTARGVKGSAPGVGATGPFAPPTASLTLLRVASSVMPTSASILAASLASSARSPSSKCSVPIRSWPSARASTSANATAATGFGSEILKLSRGSGHALVAAARASATRAIIAWRTSSPVTHSSGNSRRTAARPAGLTAIISNP